MIVHAAFATEYLREVARGRRCPMCERAGGLVDTLSPDHLGVECQWCEFEDLEPIAGLVTSD